MTPASLSSLFFALFTLALLAANAAVVRSLVELARGNPTASHLVLVPVVTLALLYQDRKAIRTVRRPAWRSGAALTGAGLILVVVGRIEAGFDEGSALSLAVAGMVVSWAGGFLFFFGQAAFKAALFPLTFLIFAIPIPAVVVDVVTDMLKRGSTSVVAAFFTLSGTPFQRDGFRFDLPGFAIEIADECSGIRSSIALLLSGLLAAHSFLRRPWSQCLLVLAILPLSVIKNGIRIAVLSLLAIHADPGFLTGRLHHEGGIVFFLLTLAMLAPVLVGLRTLESNRRDRSPALTAAQSESIA
jgi:exosortase